MSAIKITFSKMTPNPGVAGDGAVMDVIKNASPDYVGDCVAHIEMSQVSGPHSTHLTAGYEVIVWAPGVDGWEGGRVAVSKTFGVAGINASVFPCKHVVTTGDFDNPRTALAAAKRWAREQVSA